MRILVQAVTRKLSLKGKMAWDGADNEEGGRGTGAGGE